MVSTNCKLDLVTSVFNVPINPCSLLQATSSFDLIIVNGNPNSLSIEYSHNTVLWRTSLAEMTKAQYILLISGSAGGGIFYPTISLLNVIKFFFRLIFYDCIPFYINR